MNKDVVKFMRELERDYGFVFKKQRSGHAAIVYEGVRVGTLSLSPSDARWRQNTLRDLRRAGACA